MKNYKPATGEDLMRFERYIITDDIQGMRDYFAEGYSPDICAGGGRWSSENPLWRICNSASDEYDMIKVLLDADADVTLRPYIWHALNFKIKTEEDIAWLNGKKEREQKPIHEMTTEEFYKYSLMDIEHNADGITLESLYKKLSLLIEYGADVDMKGAPDRFLFPPTDFTHQQYFKNEGTYPIELAIKKNLPAIVDLILAHSKIGLTEECIKIAEETNDPAMIEKIQRLWSEVSKN